MSLVSLLLAPLVAIADGLMFVPAGGFWMGRDDGPPEEAPMHRVFVADFWIERHKDNATERGDDRPSGASPYGVEDLLGNLREWTATVFRAYPYRPDAARFTGAGEVVVRGASHDDPAETLSLATRRRHGLRGAAAGHHFVRFRCATSEDLGEVSR